MTVSAVETSPLFGNSGRGPNSPKGFKVCGKRTFVIVIICEDALKDNCDGLIGSIGSVNKALLCDKLPQTGRQTFTFDACFPARQIFASRTQMSTLTK